MQRAECRFGSRDGVLERRNIADVAVGIANALRSQTFDKRLRGRIGNIDECYAAPLRCECGDKRSTDAGRTARDKNAASREVRIPRTIVETLGQAILPYELSIISISRP
jgi:hypothetical protein